MTIRLCNPERDIALPCHPAYNVLDSAFWPISLIDYVPHGELPSDRLTANHEDLASRNHASGVMGTRQVASRNPG